MTTMQEFQLSEMEDKQVYFPIPECMHFMENAPHREYNKISFCHLKPCRHDLLKTSKHNTYLPTGRLRVNACPGTCNQCT